MLLITQFPHKRSFLLSTVLCFTVGASNQVVLEKASDVLPLQLFIDSEAPNGTISDLHGEDSVLHREGLNGQIPDIQILLDENADINAQGTDGNTPLHLAVNRGDRDFVLALLTAGAKVDVANNEGFTPLFIAIRIHSPEIARLLISEHADIEARCQGGFTPFLYSVIWGEPEVCSLLMRAGCETNVQDDKGRTALHWAPHLYKHEFITALLKAGADPNVLDENGVNPLYVAAEAERTFEEGPIHEKYIGSDCGSIVEIDQDYVMKSVEDYVESVRALLGAGADPNVSHKLTGYTPVHVAIKNQSCEVVELLLESSVRLDIRCNNGLTPLDLSKQIPISGGCLAIRSMIAQAENISIDESFHKIPQSCLQDRRGLFVLETFFAQGVDVFAKNAQGESLLHRYASLSLSPVDRVLNYVHILAHLHSSFLLDVASELLTEEIRNRFFPALYGFMQKNLAKDAYLWIFTADKELRKNLVLFVACRSLRSNNHLITRLRSADNLYDDEILNSVQNVLIPTHFYYSGNEGTIPVVNTIKRYLGAQKSLSSEAQKALVAVRKLRDLRLFFEKYSSEISQSIQCRGTKKVNEHLQSHMLGKKFLSNDECAELVNRFIWESFACEFFEKNSDGKSVNDISLENPHPDD